MPMVATGSRSLRKRRACLYPGVSGGDARGPPDQRYRCRANSSGSKGCILFEGKNPYPGPASSTGKFVRVLRGGAITLLRLAQEQTSSNRRIYDEHARARRDRGNLVIFRAFLFGCRDTSSIFTILVLLTP